MAKKMIGLRCKNFRADTLQLKRLYKKFVTISEDALLQRNGEIDLHLYNVVGKACTLLVTILQISILRSQFLVAEANPENTERIGR